MNSFGEQPPADLELADHPQPRRRAAAITGACCGTPGLLTTVDAAGTSSTPSVGAWTGTPAAASSARVSSLTAAASHADHLAAARPQRQRGGHARAGEPDHEERPGWQWRTRDHARAFKRAAADPSPRRRASNCGIEGGAGVWVSRHAPWLRGPVASFRPLAWVSRQCRRAIASVARNPHARGCISLQPSRGRAPVGRNARQRCESRHERWPPRRLGRNAHARAPPQCAKFARREHAQRQASPAPTPRADDRRDALTQPRRAPAAARAQPGRLGLPRTRAPRPRAGGGPPRGRRARCRRPSRPT